MQDLHTADSLGEHASDQVNVIFLGFLCEIEGAFAEENPWATEKNYVPPFFQIHRETFCDKFQWNSNL